MASVEAGPAPMSGGVAALGPTSAAAMHDGGANYAFVDGHVKWLTPSQLVTGWQCPSAAYSPTSTNFAFCGK
jgi:prepilin-type processing-associated H-X9-DG protein